MIYQLPLVVVLAIGLVATGIALIPDTSETALIYYKSERYKEALKLYKHSADRKNPKVETYRGLAELHIHFGDVDKAIKVVEAYLQRNPKDVSALRRLARYYQYAQRYQDYRRVLEKLRRLAPTVKVLRDLANIYNQLGRYGEQAEVLRSLIQRADATPEDYLQLARLLASEDAPAKAAAVLEDLSVASPDNFDLDTVLLQASLRAQLGERERALAVAAKATRTAIDHEVGQPPMHVSEELAQALAYRGDAALAASYLARVRAGHPAEYEVAALRASYRAQAGEAEAALATYRELFAAGNLPRAYMDSAGELALDREAYGFAFTLARQVPLALGQRVLVRIVETAVTRDEGQLARGVIDAAGPGLLEASPVLGVRLALRRGDRESANAWADKALKADLKKLNRQFALIDQLVKLGRGRDARRYLDAMLLAERAEPLPDWALRSAASQYTALQAQERGYRVFDKLAERWPDRAAVAFGRAVLAAAAGRQGLALAWWRDQDPQSFTADQLDQLFYAARSGNAGRLARAVGEVRFDRDGSPQNRYELAVVLAELEAYAAARQHLEALLANGTAPDRQAVRERYLAVLMGLYKRGEPVADEIRAAVAAERQTRPFDPDRWQTLADALLRVGADAQAMAVMETLMDRGVDGWLYTYVATAEAAGQPDEARAVLKQRLNRAGLSPDRRAFLTYSYLGLAGAEAALPFVRKLANAGRAGWQDRYERLLRQVRGADALAAYLMERVARGHIPPEQQRATAQRLLALGHKESAVTILKTLAADDAPDSQAVADLLYLWGPRPPREGVAWLATRTRAAETPAARAGWARHLLAHGAPGRAVAALGRPSRAAGRFGPVTEVLLDAYRRLDDKEGLRKLVAEAVATAPDLERRLRAADLAYTEGFSDLARQGYERVLALAPGQPRALRRRGRLAYFADNGERARTLLDRYLAGEPAQDDWKSRYYRGQLAKEAGARRRMRRLYRRARRIIAVQDSRPVAMAIADGRMAYALGQAQQGRRIFETLLARGEAARAQALPVYARILLARGKTERAGELLEGAGV